MRETWEFGKRLAQQAKKQEGLAFKGKRSQGGGAELQPRYRIGVLQQLSLKLGLCAHPHRKWRPLKLLTLIDIYTGQCLTIRAQRRLQIGAILDILGEVMNERGVSQCIRSDDSPDFIVKEVQSWSNNLGISTI